MSQMNGTFAHNAHNTSSGTADALKVLLRADLDRYAGVMSHRAEK
jgi:hypothetical protein